MTAFRWQDGERLVLFGPGVLETAAAEVLSGEWALLTTPRAAAAAPMISERARWIHHVPAGRVDELAAALRPSVGGDLLVALGGGRVIDVAKALAAADPPRRVVAVPTTLSGAEMTAIHRHAVGVAPGTPRVRPAVVLNDPALSASQPVHELAQSAGNALGHAVEGPLTPLGNPVARLAALEAARLIAGSFSDPQPDRDALALAALLAGYVIGSTGYGLHHVVSQTLARFAGVSHGVANAITLPHSIRVLDQRFPGWVEPFADAAASLQALIGPTRLREVGVTEADLERCAQEASKRPELQMTPPPAGVEELRALYAAAY